MKIYFKYLKGLANGVSYFTVIYGKKSQKMQSLRVGNYGSQIYNRYFVPLIVTVSVAYLISIQAKSH